MTSTALPTLYWTTSRDSSWRVELGAMPMRRVTCRRHGRGHFMGSMQQAWFALRLDVVAACPPESGVRSEPGVSQCVPHAIRARMGACATVVPDAAENLQAPRLAQPPFERGGFATRLRGPGNVTRTSQQTKPASAGFWFSGNRGHGICRCELISSSRVSQENIDFDGPESHFDGMLVPSSRVSQGYIDFGGTDSHFDGTAGTLQDELAPLNSPSKTNSVVDSRELGSCNAGALAPPPRLFGPIRRPPRGESRNKTYAQNQLELAYDAAAEQQALPQCSNRARRAALARSTSVEGLDPFLAGRPLYLQHLEPVAQHNFSVTQRPEPQASGPWIGPSLNAEASITDESPLQLHHTLWPRQEPPVQAVLGAAATLQTRDFSLDRMQRLKRLKDSQRAALSSWLDENSTSETPYPSLSVAILSDLQEKTVIMRPILAEAGIAS